MSSRTKEGVDDCRDERYTSGMPIAAVNTPAAHAFVALFVDPTGSVVPCSAVQGSGPTAEDALEEATRCLGTAEGLAAFRTGPRLAACLALGDYAPETRFAVDNAGAEPRAELTCDDEVAEALADVAVALARGRGQWAGRDWDDSERVCPDWTDEQITRAFAQNDGRLDVTAWGILDNGDPSSQRWGERGAAVARRLARAVEEAGKALRFADDGSAVTVEDGEIKEDSDAAVAVREACDALRDLAQESDDAVAEEAALAEEAAADALRAAEAGEVDEAVEAAEHAAALERAFGDAPTWGPLLEAVRRWAEARQEAEDEAA